MDRIFFEGIRCFATRQEVPQAPLTVLVGENSSGKTTVLALVRLAWDLAVYRETPDFNEEPFLLGAYEQIASRTERGPRETFLIGMEGPFRQQASGLFTSRAGQPVLAELNTDVEWHRRPPSLGARPYAFAPVRSRPQRTYDPIRGIARPERL